MKNETITAPRDLIPVKQGGAWRIPRYIGLPSETFHPTRDSALAEVESILDFESSQRDELRCGC